VLCVKGGNKLTSFTYVFDNEVPVLSHLKMLVKVEPPKDFIITLQNYTLAFVKIRIVILKNIYLDKNAWNRM
jgi:hypothetical protein